MTLRAAARAAAEIATHTVGVPAWGRRRRANQSLVLAYHNIIPDDAPPAGDRSLHLPLAAFRDQLDQLAKTHAVVPVSALFEPSSADRPRVAITFDDAYRGAVLLGLPELARRGLPATVFVAPGLVGAESFWWDRFAPDHGAWDEAERAALLEGQAGRSEAIEAWAVAAGRPRQTLSPWHRGATEAELATAIADPGMTVGNHSWSHPNLAAVDDADFGVEIERVNEWLARFSERSIPWLAYPYGHSAHRAIRAAARAGLKGAFEVTGGWLPSSISEPFRLPRWNVPAGISSRGFALRIAGFWCR